MMQHVGMQIRKLRKEKNLTLQQLAGERLTKGMLSLIENGKAQPSMESLHYIAEQLGVPITILLHDETSSEAASVVTHIESVLEAYNHLPTEEAREALRIRELKKLQQFIEKSTFKTFAEVDVYYYYASYFTLELSEEKERLLRNVMQHYERFHTASHVVRCYLRLIEMYFSHRRYEEAYAIALEAHDYIEQHDKHIDVLRKIDIYYFIVALASAIGQKQMSRTYTDKILALCKEFRVYYNTNELYRLRFSESIVENPEEARYFLTKMEQFATFTEDATEQTFFELVRIYYVVHVEKDYTQALSLANSMTNSDVSFFKELFECMMFGIKGMIYYYLQRYDEALAQLTHFHVVDQAPHPFDLCNDYCKIAMRGVCYIERGDVEQGCNDIRYAYEQTKPFVDNMYKNEIKQFYDNYCT
ncbi:MAG: helix-turn-helix transcriptional regulator [Caryophanon sp.]|nr:helix-turn-helix transcriptional regulator [Caryophanon sp.]